MVHIIRDIASHRVLYAGDVTLTESGVFGPGFADYRATPDVVEALEAPALPEHYRGGCWSFDGMNWALIDANLLDEIKGSLRARINATRDAKETQGFMYAGLLFQSDERSASRIANAALTATACIGAGIPFSVDWASEDNQTITLDAQGMLALQGALTTHAAALHYHARALKSQVDAAQTIDALSAIDINAGWPK